MFFGIIISDSRAYEESIFSSPAGDKLKATEIKASRKLELGGQDWEFKVTIKNENSIKSSGESFNVVIKIKSGNNLITTKTVTLDPPQISAGKTYMFTFSMDPLVENQVIEGEFSIIMDTVQDALTGITKQFRIR